MLMHSDQCGQSEGVFARVERMVEEGRTFPGEEDTGEEKDCSHCILEPTGDL